MSKISKKELHDLVKEELNSFLDYDKFDDDEDEEETPKEETKTYSLYHWDLDELDGVPIEKLIERLQDFDYRYHKFDNLRLLYHDGSFHLVGELPLSLTTNKKLLAYATPIENL